MRSPHVLSSITVLQLLSRVPQSDGADELLTLSLRERHLASIISVFLPVM